MSKTVLITRPIIQSRLYAGELAALGIESVVEPMLEFEALAFDLPDLAEYQALLFTSAQAVKVFVQAMHEEPLGLAVFCVGETTAQAARDCGFADVFEAGGNANSLVAYVLDECRDKSRKLLHVRGEHVAKPLHVMLAAQGYKVDILLVYRTVKADNLSDKIIDTIRSGKVLAVSFFSARTAEAFVEAAAGVDLSRVKSLSISDSVLESVEALDWADSLVARYPNRAGMTALIKEICGR